MQAPTELLVAPAPARPAWLLPGVLVLVALLAAAVYFALGRTSKPVVAVEHPLPKSLMTSTGEMVLVPAGAFLFGEKKEQISLPAFYIDKTEVRNKDYADFCAAAQHPLPKDFPADQPDYPVVNVSFVDAQQFAVWAGKKLPTGHQWEKSARGTEGWLFPWGNEKDLARANVNPNPRAGIDPGIDPLPLQPVTAFPNGASAFGALNMVGNVWELVDQTEIPSARTLASFANRMDPPPSADDKWNVIRGGSSSEYLFDALIWDHTTVPANWKNKNIGFRCVKDPPKDAGEKK
jgi:formylglycine-generating enzyme required for sulfatase activity